MTTYDARPAMDPPADLTVGATAALIGVSVRTLHHWDAIGLVRPSGRTSGDYRVYSADDIARLHRVLVYRELGIPLAQVADILDDPAVDEAQQLRRQREALVDRIAHLHGMVRAVDTMLEARTMGTQLTPQEQAEIFGANWRPEYQEEAEQRWGDTPQWAQSQQRTANFTKDDWIAVKAEHEALMTDLGAAKRSGVAPDSPEAAALVERHRLSIDRYYDCSTSMQVCLAKMYLCDERFKATYEEVEPGLTQWLYDAVAAVARSKGIDPETANWA